MRFNAYCPTVSQSVKIFAFGYMMYVENDVLISKCSDAPPLSYRRLVGAKAIKLVCLFMFIISFLLTDSQKPKKQSAILIHSCPLVTVPATVSA